MPQPTLAFDSAELTAAVAPPPPGPRRRAAWRAVLGRPSGAAGAALTGATLLVALVGPLAAAVDPFALVGAPLAAPSARHPMGTDAVGRDLLSGVLFGARTSLLVAVAASAIAFALGAAVGLVSGWRGGLLDDLLMRVTELFQVLPRFFLIVVAVALLGPGVDRVAMTLGLTAWPVLARVVRGEVVAMRELEFVTAARASGASEARILWHELLPNVLPSALVMVGLLFGQVILLEASLGFLGLGDPNVVSWGLLAGQAQGFVRVAWWLAVFPGVAIAVTVLGVNLLADAWAAALGGR